MKTIMRLLIAVMCLAGFSSLALADELGMKDAMKGEKQGDEGRDELQGGRNGWLRRANTFSGSSSMACS